MKVKSMCTLQQGKNIKIYLYSGLLTLVKLKYLGKPQANKSSSTLDFCWTPLTPPPCIFGHIQGTFFPVPYQAGKSSSNSFDFGQAPPPFFLFGKCPNFSWKGSLKGLDLTSPLPPSFIKNFQTQAEKRFFEKFLKSFGFGLDLPLQQKSKIELLVLPCGFPKSCSKSFEALVA